MLVRITTTPRRNDLLETQWQVGGPPGASTSFHLIEIPRHTRCGHQLHFTYFASGWSDLSLKCYRRGKKVRTQFCRLPFEVFSLQRLSCKLSVLDSHDLQKEGNLKDSAVADLALRRLLEKIKKKRKRKEKKKKKKRKGKEKEKEKDKKKKKNL